MYTWLPQHFFWLGIKIWPTYFNSNLLGTFINVKGAPEIIKNNLEINKSERNILEVNKCESDKDLQQN